MSDLSHGGRSCKVANTVYICSDFKCFYVVFANESYLLKKILFFVWKSGESFFFLRSAPRKDEKSSTLGSKTHESMKGLQES